MKLWQIVTILLKTFVLVQKSLQPEDDFIKTASVLFFLCFTHVARLTWYLGKKRYLNSALASRALAQSDNMWAPV